jgi:hypothetical protein
VTANVGERRSPPPARRAPTRHPEQSEGGKARARDDVGEQPDGFEEACRLRQGADTHDRERRRAASSVGRRPTASESGPKTRRHGITVNAYVA